MKLVKPSVEAITDYTRELDRYTFRFICGRGVSRKLTGHRCSPAQEPTHQYILPGKDMEFIEPWWWDIWGPQEREDYKRALSILEAVHHAYPQAAQADIPNALKTEVVVTADRTEWQRIHNLHSHPSADPNLQRLMKLWEEAGGRELL